MASPAWVGAKVTAQSMLLPYKYKATRVVVEEGLDKHDVYRLILMGVDRATAHPAFQSGAPLIMQLDSQGTQRYLYAYVVKAVQRPSGKLPPVYELLCVGATNPMKATAKGAFLRRNVSSVVQQQCSNHGIATIGSLDNTVWSDLSPQIGETEWQHVVRIVHQAGGAVCTLGAAVRLVDLAQPWNSAPRPLILNQGTIEPHVSNVGVAGDVEAALYEADFNGGTVKQAAPGPILGSGKFDHTRLPERTLVASYPSLGETMTALRSESVLSAYTHSAKMTVVGQLNLKCGTVLRLALHDPLVSEYNGLWLISTARHEITNTTGEYVTVMTLIKDSFGEPSAATAQRAANSLVTAMNVQTVWRNNQWTAIGKAA